MGAWLSTGAGAAEGLQQLLRNKMADEHAALAAKQFAEQQRSNLADEGFRTRQLDETSALRKQSQTDLEGERDYRRLSNIGETSLPGDVIDPATAGRMREAGLGSVLRMRAAQPADEGAGVLADAASNAPGTGVLAEPPKPSVLKLASPEATVSRGGSRFLAARAAGEERAQMAADAAAARLDAAGQTAQARADAAQQQREFMASQNAANRGNTMAIAQLAQSGQNERAAAAKEAKQSALDEKKATADTSAKESRDEVRRLAEEIRDDPQLSSVIGPMDARTTTVLPASAGLESRITRLQKLLALDSRSKLKGSGAISDFEARALEQSVSALNPASGESQFKTELQRIIDTTGGPKTEGDANAANHEEEWVRDPVTKKFGPKRK